MFFESWSAIGRILLSGVLAYTAVVLVLRLTGKRTLSKWNAFDFIVTIALGSILATVIVSKSVPLLGGVAALVILVVLQFVVTFLSVRVAWMRRIVKSEPTLLLYGGAFREATMRRERVTESEVRAALRAKGIGRVEDVAAVVLETDGTFSVIEDLEPDAASALRDVAGFEAVTRRTTQPDA